MVGKDNVLVRVRDTRQVVEFCWMFFSCIHFHPRTIDRALTADEFSSRNWYEQIQLTANQSSKWIWLSVKADLDIVSEHEAKF